MKSLLLFIALACLIVNPGYSLWADEIPIITNELIPWCINNNGEVSGINIDIIKKHLTAWDIHQRLKYSHGDVL